MVDHGLPPRNGPLRWGMFSSLSAPRPGAAPAAANERLDHQRRSRWLVIGRQRIGRRPPRALIALRGHRLRGVGRRYDFVAAVAGLTVAVREIVAPRPPGGRNQRTGDGVRIDDGRSVEA